MTDSGTQQLTETKQTDEEASDDDHRPAEEPVHDDHLDNVEDGCGCAEVWEHLSEERDAAED